MKETLSRMSLAVAGEHLVAQSRVRHRESRISMLACWDLIGLKLERYKVDQSAAWVQHYFVMSIRKSVSNPICGLSSRSASILAGNFS